MPQLKANPEDCAFGEFIHLAAAPDWDPAKHTIWQFADPAYAPSFEPGDGGYAHEVARHIWIFSLKPWHDPATGKEAQVWQRVA